MHRESSVPDFAPDAPTDGRPVGQWESRYPPVAQQHIRVEAIYLAAILVMAPTTACFISALSSSVSAGEVPLWRPLIFGTLGGLLGGTLFAVKWLYHSVAKHIWNIDRRLWRLLTPPISGGLAFAFIALINSGILLIIDTTTVRRDWVCFAIGFLVGYFSDSATAKLTEVAQTIFGVVTDRSPGGAASGYGKEPSDNTQPAVPAVADAKSAPIRARDD